MLVNEIINAKDLPVIDFDAIIIGGGGAGMRASIQLAQSGLKTAVVSKVFPTRSHTVSAQGGITCAIQSDDPEDDWRWHMFDTVKGSDYIGDQDAIEYMCSEGPKAVFELEHMGLPFSRTTEGKIYQRPFGGQSKDYGKGGQASRTCAAADRTGHSLLHTLYQANLKAGTNFLNEWFAVDLVLNLKKSVVGVIAFHIESGEIFFIRSKATVLATGGAGRIYASTTNALINSGDGIGMALRAGFPVQDIEMWQFHPTGIHGAGTLVTEGCRGEGGYLVNKDGERFMERYAPNTKDLASRDVVSRSMSLEIIEGRGCGPNEDHILLRLDHLGPEVVHKRLPGITELCKTFAHVDPAIEPIPVVPTCHYMMGGIPTNINGQVINHKEGKDEVVEGLYAAGEVACVSVHGGNRLGANSLLDTLVFGRRSGIHASEAAKYTDHLNIDDSHSEADKNIIQMLMGNPPGESFGKIRYDLGTAMKEHFGVYRNKEQMYIGLSKINSLRDRARSVHIADKTKTFNTNLLFTIELGFMIECAEAIALSAIDRTESRGAHTRTDLPNRDDENWLKHILISYSNGGHHISYKDVVITEWEPTKRQY